jgi:transposase
MVTESYRPGPGMAPKCRTIKSFGYLEDQPDQESFMKEVEKFEANYRSEDYPITVKIEKKARIYNKGRTSLNYGYKFIEAIYDILEIDKFVKEFLKQHKFKGKIEVGQILKYLVIERIISPDSKRSSYRNKKFFYGMDNSSFDLKDVYRALDQFANFEIELQRHLNERIKLTVGRELKNAFFDLTNYYFEIDFPDGEDDLRKRGFSKENRNDPIIAMSLLIDTNGIPVNMCIFPGNTSETTTLLPTISEVKESYGYDRIVVTADKGLNSAKNINAIVNAGDGFVFSTTIKGNKGNKYEKEIKDEKDWICNADNTYKTKLFTEEYDGIDSSGKKVKRERKVLLYWSKAQADRQRKIREEKIKKAEKDVKNGTVKSKKGSEEYIKETIVDKKTGEVIEKVKKVRSVDQEKIEKDAELDGYYCIITSELDYSAEKIREIYGGLWRIEQSFRILKSDLFARPVYVRNNNHIRGHFLTCFIALIIMRFIQKLMGDKALSTERIVRVLKKSECLILPNGMVRLDSMEGGTGFEKRLNKKGVLVDTMAESDKEDDDELIYDSKLINSLFGTNFDDMFYRQEEFNSCLRGIKRNIRELLRNMK